MIPVIDLEKKIKAIEKPWSPVDVAYLNDQVIRAAVFHGDYHWHKHDGEDELFLVYRGEIIIQVKGQEIIELMEGQLCVIPKGVEHKPGSDEPSIVLMFEPSSLKSTGD
ncbi:cupin domain-containing protein [Candidatus Bathyarchaeota archaeon]|jgi:mannose-6-phosphate isomerase-like protein (cupin superfamily)|nr:cupin domain-containing protein [Candidatus Bathyarchaeota archaeon]MBT4320273.1 cupin domain-containing protein [Candidatus Bathyarchaeota archaeon]MBT6604832.1 cupin domain-containing protein [Candidatus Bathyarchaeota archaeon]MBT7347061.1 cupin domain-containing protein [Candidatus Bathyarchaeota archaeon]